MDAILAVALGGNSLSGGKFNMTASILGAYVIQFLTTTLYKFNVESAALSAYKAVVVIALVVFSAPAVRKKLAGLTKKFKPQAKEAVFFIFAILNSFYFGSICYSVPDNNTL